MPLRGSREVPQLAGRLRLEMAELVEGLDAGQAGLDEAGVGGPTARGRGRERIGFIVGKHREEPVDEQANQKSRR